MPDPAKSTTRLSTKGQVILPAAIRRRYGWTAGTLLSVEETADGVVLRHAPLFAPTTPQAVFASLSHAGPPKTVAQMDAAVAEAIARRHDRGRY